MKLALYFITSILYNLFFNPLKAFPGPKHWAISALPLEWSRITGNQVSTLLELHKKYGKIVRTAPNELSSVDAATWKEVWAHRQGQDECLKLATAPNPKGFRGILVADRADHSRFRRLLSNSFSEKGMRDQQPVIQSYVDQLIADLYGTIGKGPQDMVAWFNWTTFDVIGRLAFGEDFGCLKRCATHPWIEAIFNNLKALLFMQTFRRFGLQRLLPLIASTRAQKLRHYNYQFAADRIQSRVQRGSSENDFWDTVLRSSDLEKDARVIPDKGMNIEEMIANASNLVLAGSETTATLLSGCIYQLLRNPDWMQLAATEIRTTFATAGEIDLFSVNKLRLTLAVLEETMRIYPPVPTQANRVMPSGGVTVGGHWLPAGTIVQISQYVANHFPSNFTLAEEFHPERFLALADVESLHLMDGATFDLKVFAEDERDVMQPFGVGPRNCIGRNLAYAEMRLILAKVLWHFDFVSTTQTGEWMKSQKTFVLWEKGPLWVEVKEARRTG